MTYLCRHRGKLCYRSSHSQHGL